MLDTDYEVPLGLANGIPLATRSDVRSPTSSRTEVRSPTSTRTEVRSPTSTRTEVRSPTRTSTEVRSPTRTATEAYTQGNFTSTVTGGAGAGATHVTINIPAQNWRRVKAGSSKPVREPVFGFDINKNNVESREPAFGFDITKDAIDPSSGSLYSGGSSYSPELQGFSSAMGMSSLQLPLCQRDILGSLCNFKRGLAGLDDIMDQDVKTDSLAAVANAATAGSSYAAPFAKRLAGSAAEWANIAKERYNVTAAAREAYNRLQSQVVDLDRKTVELTLAKKSADAAKIKKEAVAKAKLAVQYQKVNALSTTLADNAAAQSSILYQIASLSVAEQPDKINNLAKLYYQIVTVSKKVVDLRKKQLAGIKGGLQGVRRPFIDYFEEELNGLTRKTMNAPREAVVNGYTVEALNSKPRKFTFVGDVLKKMVARVKQTKDKMFPRMRVRRPIKTPASLWQKKSTDFGAITDFGAVPIVRPVPKINIAQIARQGTGAATATLMNSNIRGITPQQLTAMARQAQALFNGSVGSAASVVAQARRL